MITTTLNKIWAYEFPLNRWKNLLGYIGKTITGNEPLAFSVIMKNNGLQDALWCCRTVSEYDKEWRLFAVWCARQVQYLMKDERSIAVLDVAERYANGDATKKELAAAWTAARAGALTTWSAKAVGAASEAEAAEMIWGSVKAADAASYTAMESAAFAVAWTAAWAESATWTAAKPEMAGAIKMAAENAQRKRFIEIVGS